MDPVEFIGWAGTALTLTAYSMKTMLPLRVASMMSNVFSATYGALAEIYPMLVLNALLLVLNGIRLWQMYRLTRRLEEARTSDDADFNLLCAYGQTLHMADGARVFSRGDTPDAFYFVLDGRVRITEIDKTLGPGSVFGEIAFFTDAKRRTASAVCVGHCRIKAVHEADFMRLYFQHPKFGMAILKLITRRLTEGYVSETSGVMLASSR